MPITALPLYTGTPPNRSQSQDAFNTNMATWISYTTTFQPLYNAFATQANALAVEVDGYADNALLYQNNALTYSNNALSYANLAAASADFKGAWSSLTGALNRPATVSHNGSFWALLNNLANVTTSTPSLTNTDWQFISGTRWQATRTANFTVARNAMENVTATSGVINATLSAFSAGDFFCVANNPDSTSDVVIVKTGVTVTSNSGSVGPTDDILVQPGQIFYAYAINSTNLRISNNG